MGYFKHETALVESACVGEGTRIWAYAHVLEGATIGRDCNICDHTFIESGVVLGDRVTVKCGVQLWNGVLVEDDVFIGPNATFTNDAFPRAGKKPDEFLRTVVKRGASIGANATILPGITIEENVMVGAGTVVTRNVPRNAVVVGNPGQIVSYVGAGHMMHAPAAAGSEATGVEGVVFHRLPLIDDLRGNLSFAEVVRHVPFEIRRYFLVFQVPTEEVRGEHAHRAQHQFLLCVHGRCSVVADDGTERQEFLLDAPNLAVYVPPMTWAAQYKYSRDAVLLVLTSGEYDPEDYIREYSEFLELKKHG
jgi:acetyltransferase-like isoleucine patch superfamily enzyme/dTDP-4-dehydrorhamnose 3,5-epimerase-like enzyme